MIVILIVMQIILKKYVKYEFVDGNVDSKTTYNVVDKQIRTENIEVNGFLY